MNTYEVRHVIIPLGYSSNEIASMTPAKHMVTILIRPQTEWSRIAAAAMTVPMLYLGYIVPLSAIGTVASQIRLTYEINSNPGIELFLGLHWGLTLPGMLFNYMWELFEVFFLAILANGIAPMFSGERNFPQALKVVTFSLTSIWVGRLFIAIPFFSLDWSMTILSTLYSVYLLHIGLTLLMKTSPPKSFMYTITVATAYWGATHAGRTAGPTFTEFIRQWPVSNQGTKTTVLVFILLSAIGLAVFLAYRRTIIRGK